MKQFQDLEEFKKAINDNKINILFFTASWCGPCKTMYPFVNELAEKIHKFLFIKLM